MASDRAYLMNPGVSDAVVYSYGPVHDILEGRFSRGSFRVTRVQVEGYDETTGEAIITDSFAWDEAGLEPERFEQVLDRNIGSVPEAQARGEAYLRKAAIRSEGGLIRVPLNSGQELYDVIEVTDERAGLTAAKRRVLGMSMLYDTRKGIYEQKLYLGAI